MRRLLRCVLWLYWLCFDVDYGLKALLFCVRRRARLFKILRSLRMAMMLRSERGVSILVVVKKHEVRPVYDQLYFI